MWMITRHGLISVVADKKMPDIMVVRARRKKDLESIISVIDGYKLLEGKDLPAVIDTNRSGFDYPYRLKLEKEVWELLAYNLAAEVDYTNFKGEGIDPKDQALLAFAHRVWEVGISDLENWRAYEENEKYMDEDEAADLDAFINDFRKPIL